MREWKLLTLEMSAHIAMKERAWASLIMAESGQMPNSVPANRPVTRKQRFVIGLVVLASMVLFPMMRILVGGSAIEPTYLAEISPRELLAARQLWTDRGPPHYDMAIDFIAPATRTSLAVQVRGGVARSLVKNGIAVSREDEMAQWTVEGQFRQIEKYIQMDTSPAAKNAGWSMRNVGRFDEQFGYPADYSRQGNGHQVKYHIIVTKFTPVNP